MRIARGNGTLASSSGMISLTVTLGLAPSSTRTPPHQHRNLKLHLFAEAPVCLRKDHHFHRAGHVFQRRLRVEIAPLRLRTRKPVIMPAVEMFSSLPVDFFMAPISSV